MRKATKRHSLRLFEIITVCLGYLFAGWFTKDNRLYTTQSMPEDGVLLKAGWYREKTANKAVIPGNKDYSPRSSKVELRNELTIDLSELLPEDFHGMIKV